MLLVLERSPATFQQVKTALEEGVSPVRILNLIDAAVERTPTSASVISAATYGFDQIRNLVTDAEREDREEFVVEACYLMRDRFRGEEVFETLGLNVKECAEYVDTSPLMIQFRSHLFSRIVPIVKDIGLWGPKVQKAFIEMGVDGLADSDIDGLMKADEDQAEDLDRAHAEMSSRVAEVDEAIAAGAS